PGRRLPLPPHRVEVAALLALDLMGVVALVVGGVAARRRGRAEGDVALALGLLCVGALPQALQRAEAFHVGSAAVVCAGLLPLGLAHLRDPLQRPKPRRLAAAVTLAGAVIGTGALAAPAVLRPAVDYRSEERRVGKEW